MNPRKATKLVGLMAVGLLCAGPIQAQNDGATPRNGDEFKATDVANQKSYEGTVTEINPEARTIAVRRFLISHTFQLGPEAMLMGANDMRLQNLSDIKVGDKVNVIFTERNGDKLINRLSLVEQANGSRPAARVDERDYRAERGGITGEVRSADTKQYDGTVSVVDTQANTISVKRMLVSHTFQCDANCEIVGQGNRKLNLSDIKVGDEVTLVFTERNGQKIAQQIALEGATLPTATGATVGRAQPVNGARIETRGETYATGEPVTIKTRILQQGPVDHFMGTVENVDFNRALVTVRAGDVIRTFNLTQPGAIVFSRPGTMEEKLAEINATQLRVGDRVDVTYSTYGNDWLAHTITTRPGEWGLAPTGRDEGRPALTGRDEGRPLATGQIAQPTRPAFYGSIENVDANANRLVIRRSAAQQARGEQLDLNQFRQGEQIEVVKLARPAPLPAAQANGQRDQNLEPTGAPTGAMEGQLQEKTFAGTITKIDQMHRILTVRNENNETRTFHLGGFAKFGAMGAQGGAMRGGDLRDQGVRAPEDTQRFAPPGTQGPAGSPGTQIRRTQPGGLETGGTPARGDEARWRGEVRNERGEIVDQQRGGVALGADDRMHGRSGFGMFQNLREGQRVNISYIENANLITQLSSEGMMSGSSMQQTSIRGTVESVDANRGTLTVRTEQGQQRLDLFRVGDEVFVRRLSGVQPQARQ